MKFFTAFYLIIAAFSLPNYLESFLPSLAAKQFRAAANGVFADQALFSQEEIKFVQDTPHLKLIAEAIASEFEKIEKNPLDEYPSLEYKNAIENTRKLIATLPEDAIILTDDLYKKLSGAMDALLQGRKDGKLLGNIHAENQDLGGALLSPSGKKQILETALIAAGTGVGGTIVGIHEANREKPKSA